jgi:hypothetical protein
MNYFEQSIGQMWSVRRWTVLQLILGLAILIVSPGIIDMKPVFAQTPENRLPQTLDDQFSAVAKQVPQFGGMFLSGNQATLQVYLTDVSPETIAAVQKAIANTFGSAVIPKNGMQARRGRFGFEQLRDWYKAMAGPVSRTPGVTMTDIDEANNRLSIGLDKNSSRARVLTQLAKMNIPANAVAFVVTGPIVPLAQKLQNRQSPMEGGYQIERPISASSASDCTLSFTAERGNTTGFVTASHCTRVPWAVDSSPFYQPTVFPATNFIGTETVDPPGFVCPPTYPGKTCRWSDSAFVAYAVGVTAAPGPVGRTTGITTNWLSPNITIDNNRPIFHIIAPPSQPFLVGLTLDKVGRTSGWSEGSISSTCVDFPWTPLSNTEILCQYIVHCPNNGCAVEGDSGSPVFRITNLPKSYVELYGVLWARFFGSHVWFVFSPITGVEADLGPLNYSDACILVPNPC